MASSPILHYLYDPLCGWCYGAASLVKAARNVLSIHAHGGGMMSGDRAQRVTLQLRNYVLPHDRQIARTTGQPFGAAYFDGLLRDTTAVFDSTPPIAAMLAAEKIGGRGLDLIARLQTAHYVEGRRIADDTVLVEMAGAIGLESTAFVRALEAAKRGEVHSHIAETRRLMAEIGGQGFPTFALESAGRIKILSVSKFFGRPDELSVWLRHELSNEGAGSNDAKAGRICGPEGCSL